MLRFLPGIILNQVASAILVFTFMDSHGASWIPYATLAVIAGLLTAFWLSSIASHLKKDALSRVKEKLSQEREQILIASAKEKNRIFEQTHKRILKETNQAHAKANLKVGAVAAGAVGVGIGLLSIQFFTIGILTLLTTGGVLTGYIIRARRNALPSSKEKIAKEILPKQESPKLIEINTLDTTSLHSEENLNSSKN
ncbi:hypothetical protein [Candidatus Nitrosoglobus terrae]|nr:hypothetical protein [Candidatus Nitrosoglobus terrae]